MELHVLAHAAAYSPVTRMIRDLRLTLHIQSFNFYEDCNISQRKSINRWYLATWLFCVSVWVFIRPFAVAAELERGGSQLSFSPLYSGF